ncbi:putative membrane protein [Campylobacter blaseri]|uniref:Uncharacterized protein n=1 Tax=Campylobacter blaseri TaxID=2042961 RepID=A0A2P8QZS5_9BACT|nr:hypothetical protein [Campylobacter blaseri]PSM51754.1 hypothetical protein CQ405_06390 [Campylobacter blaseri]PSM53545.1 hypothetical protein CRN67_06395 [Campylobacter blaseri]QKF86352.1 putative membrane protein [Campylobacter blaseri]
MLKSVFSIFIVVFLALFFIFIQDFYCFNIILFFILFTLVIFLEIFSYKYGYRIVFNSAFFANSSIFKRLFSGKLTISFISVFISLFYAGYLIFGLLFLTKIDFLFIFLALPSIFLLTKFTILRYFKKEFKHIDITSKKWIIILSSFISCAMYAILFFNDFDVEIIDNNFFEYLRISEPVSNFKCDILNEAYAYSFYANNSALWFKNAFLQDYKFIAIFLLFMNKFIFFIALNHLISFILSSDESKNGFGYFLNTIAVLAYVVFVFLGASYLSYDEVYEPKKKETQVEKVFKIIINNGMKFDINASSLDVLKNDINITKSKNLDNAKAVTDKYIDDIYEVGAKNLSKKLADFRYSPFVDYMVLWHSAVGKGANEYVYDKFKKFVDESFDKNFINNLENLVKIGIGKFEKDLYKDVDRNIPNTAVVAFDTNFTNIDSRNLNRVKISGFSVAGLGVGLVGKTLLKTASKTAAKTGAKIATSSGAGGSGLVCGAGAFVCVPAFAVATWFGFDYAFAKGDEFINRDEYEKSIYEEIMQNKDEFKSSINLELEKTYNEILENFYILQER